MHNIPNYTLILDVQAFTWVIMVVLLFCLQRSAINLTMSSHNEGVSQRRTSERRRLKLLRKTNQYRMSNPFRHPHALPVPQPLFQQLRRIEYLSTSAITQLSFDARASEQPSHECMLQRMHEAIQMQELRYCALLGTHSLSPDSHPNHQTADIDQQEAAKREPEGDEVVQTKDQISRNIYDPRDPRREEEFPCQVLLPDEADTPVARASVMQALCVGVLLGEEEYQNYFAN